MKNVEIMPGNESHRFRFARNWLTRSVIIRLFTLLCISILAALLSSPWEFVLTPDYRKGEFTKAPLRAPFDFSVNDEQATRIRREEAYSRSPSIIEVDESVAKAATEAVKAFFNQGGLWYTEAAKQQQEAESKVRSLPASKRKKAIEKAERDSESYIAEKFDQELSQMSQALGTNFNDLDKKLLKKDMFSQQLSDAILSLLNHVYSKPILSGPDRIKALTAGADEMTSNGHISLVVRNDTTSVEKTIDDLNLLSEPNQAADDLKANAETLLQSIDPSLRTLALKITVATIHPNAAVNRELTERRKREAATSVLPVFYNFKTNQLIIGEGQEVTEQTLVVLHYLRNTAIQKENFEKIAGSALLFAILLLMGFSIVASDLSPAELKDRDFLFVALILALYLIAFKFWMILAGRLSDQNGGMSQLSIILMFPFAALPMFTSLLFRRDVAIFQLAIAAFMLRFLSGSSLPLATYVFVVGLAGIRAVKGSVNRGQVIRAGVWVSGISIIVSYGMNLIAGESSGASGLFLILGGALGGLLSGFLVIAASPVAEWIFGYSTNIRLLEYANYEHPILKKLLLESPGTFQHSLNVGVLGEAAATAIGSDALLVRIGALFHDIGKTALPGHFIENQSGANPHDLLDPAESVKIIRSHVQKGVELLKTYKVNPRIADFVREHHGTTVMRYFFDRARKADPNVPESVFRHSGPSPRSKETAILMIADQVEAISRVMEDKSEEAFRMTVRSVIERMWDDKQFDQCPLTFQDLVATQEAMTAVLSGIHHHRIKY